MKKRMLTEFGMGSSLRRQDCTQAAVRAVTDALWHNSINLAVQGGLDVPRDDGGKPTVIVNAAISVSFAMEG